MGEGAGREDSDKKTPSPFVAALPPPPLPIIDRYTVRSLRASSPIEPREWLRKGLSLPQFPLSCPFSRASRASAFHDIPQMESFLAGKKVRSKTVAVCGVFYNLWRGILKVQKTFSKV